MGSATAIAWTDHTFNPWWGCTRVSPACASCYAETFAHRLGLEVWGKNAERRFFGPGHWTEPIRWNRRAAEAGRRELVFCASMADVFEDRDDLLEERARLFALIVSTPHLTWQLLTKRPENVRRMVPSSWLMAPATTAGNLLVAPVDVAEPGWPANVWIGTTVEDQTRAEERIPFLLEIPAPVRFLSCEPLLGALDLSRFLWTGLGWIIAGGESGNGFRPLDLDFARDLRDQARAAEVPFFFKQVGGRTPTAGGDELDGKTLKAFPAGARR